MKLKIRFLLNLKVILILFGTLTVLINAIQSGFLENSSQMEDEPLTDLETYCVQQGGDVKRMVAQYDTHAGWVDGITKKFCFFENQKENTLALFGLEALGSLRSNFAATFIKTIHLDPTKPIPGPYGLVNMNLCHQLRGAMISFATNGGYDRKGQADLCFFGDGSSVSGWTLYYIGLGYFEDLRAKARSEPLAIDLPDVYFDAEDQH